MKPNIKSYMLYMQNKFFDEFSKILKSSFNSTFKAKTLQQVCLWQ